MGAAQVAVFSLWSIIGQGVTRMAAEKPSIEEVLRYAEPIIQKFISKDAADLPFEQKEEIKQSARLRLFRAYKHLDPEAGWRSFVYNHCRGAVLDYLKFGKGFQETSWSLLKEEPEDSKNLYKIHRRVDDSVFDDGGGEDFDIDRVLGSNGVFSDALEESITINWDLLARLASKDECLHAFAKYLRGFGVNEMAPVFGLKRARVGQLLQSFINRFDDPEEADSPWFKQCCYALGVCKLLGMPEVDQSTVLGFSVGWNLDPVDLDSLEPHHSIVEADSQMGWDV